MSDANGVPAQKQVTGRCRPCVAVKDLVRVFDHRKQAKQQAAAPRVERAEQGSTCTSTPDEVPGTFKHLAPADEPQLEMVVQEPLTSSSLQEASPLEQPVEGLELIEIEPDEPVMIENVEQPRDYIHDALMGQLEELEPIQVIPEPVDSLDPIQLTPEPVELAASFEQAADFNELAPTQHEAAGAFKGEREIPVFEQSTAPHSDNSSSADPMQVSASGGAFVPELDASPLVRNKVVCGGGLDAALCAGMEASAAAVAYGGREVVHAVSSLHQYRPQLESMASSVLQKTAAAAQHATAVINASTRSVRETRERLVDHRSSLSPRHMQAAAAPSSSPTSSQRHSAGAERLLSGIGSPPLMDRTPVYTVGAARPPAYSMPSMPPMMPVYSAPGGTAVPAVGRTFMRQATYPTAPINALPTMQMISPIPGATTLQHVPQVVPRLSSTTVPRKASAF
eukprot:TRINITY_DN91672_c0_g1_i1.p1 TRINITY_DN91672_c0_g1~~TRINITY_DN91672_c0_g1_i1.p1  ORF type:complete len:482 (-),score=71.11 TRINITY_DN91672_c0_g1_i1:158-1513(-)